MTAAAGWIIAILEAALLVSAWVRLILKESEHKRECASCKKRVNGVLGAIGWEPDAQVWNASQRAEKR